jgi:exonuclease VII large subunit
MVEGKIRVSARIPKELYDRCLQRYDNITTAINTGLETICQQNEDKCQSNEDICRQDVDKQEIDEDDTNRGILQELKIRLEEKDKQIEEKERHIETLKTELATAHEDKNTIQNHYDNYMRQMQTLIQQKTIEAPGEKKWWQFWK